MKEEIRQRYKKWMGEPGEKIRVAPMAEEDYFLGRMLKRMREYRLISLEAMAKGICAKGDLEFMEKGVKADLLIAGIYLGRMGRSISKFEFYFTQQEYRKQRKRDAIVKSWKTNRLDEARRYLEEYERKDETKYANYWCSLQRRCIALRGDAVPEDGGFWEGLSGQTLYFLPEEVDYLYERAGFYERRNDMQEARKAYEMIYQNTLAGVCLDRADAGMDEERQLEILPELCLRYGHFERMCGEKEAALRILDIAVGVLHGCMRMELLEELLEERIAVMGESGREGVVEGMEEGVGKDMKELITLALARGDIRKAQERLCRLKEEKWENTILGNLSSVLGKLLG